MTVPVGLAERLGSAVLARSGKRIAGGEIRFRCPHAERHRRGDHRPSARWSTARGVWCCDSCGGGGGAVQLAALLGIALPPRINGGAYADGRPPGVPSRIKDGNDWADFRCAWTYRAADGSELGVVARFETPDGSKAIRPYFKRVDGRWRPGAAPKPRPLYGLDRLAARPEAPVLVCEGERAADAAERLLPDHVGVTSPGGALAASKADWRPLAGRRVTAWPDRDDVGERYAAADVPRELRRVDAVVVGVVDVEVLGLPHGGDAADLETLPDCGLPLRASQAGATADVAGGPVEHQGQREDVDRQPGTSTNKKPQAEILLQLAADAELFHDDRTTYAGVEVNGHRETLQIRGSAFKGWLRLQYYRSQQDKAPNAQAVQDAIGTLEGRALFEGEQHKVHVRLAGDEERICLDLGREDWSVVEITAAGWRVVTKPPFRFRRPAGLLPLPVPESGGSVKDLKPYINVETEVVDRLDDFVLTVAWLVAALRPRGPYPVLVVNGEQGSAKSTTCRVLRELVDPNASPLRTAPRDERDLAIAARNGWALGFDNMPRIPDSLSDALCRLATGGGLATRRLYTDSEEELFDAVRPVLVNGIGEVATRSDLIDRSVTVTLPRIRPQNRRPERDFWAEFALVQPRILGALLDTVAVGLGELQNVHLAEHPRMADFAEWVCACTPALPFTGEQFLAAYTANRRGALEASLGGDPVADAMLIFDDTFKGTAGELLAFLSEQVSEAARTSRHWPRSPQGMGTRLRRIAPALREAGFEIEFHGETGHDNRRLISIVRQTGRVQHGSQDSQCSQADGDGGSRCASSASDTHGPTIKDSQNDRPDKPRGMGVASMASNASHPEPTRSKGATNEVLDL